MLKERAKAFECKYGVGLALNRNIKEESKERLGRRLPSLYIIPQRNGGSILRKSNIFKNETT